MQGGIHAQWEYLCLLLSNNLMKLCWGILPLIAVLLTCVAQAQCVDTRHFTNADGLPENTPFAMLQDRRGNLWVGTRSGACWYDGHQFHALPPGQFATDQNVTALAEAPDGTLWFGHAYGGLSWLRRGQGRAFLPHGYAPPNLVQTLFCNDNTTLWVGSDRGLFRCHFAASDTTITRPTLVASQPEAAVNALCQGPPGQLLVATEAGLAVVEQASGRVVAAQLPPVLTRNPCSFVSRVNDTLFWVCGPNIGLVRLSYRRGAGTWAAQSYRKAQGLCANNVLNALQDRAGRVWALTPAGLSRIDVDGRVSCFLDDKQLQLTDFPNVLLEDREGNLWSGHGAGGLHQRLGDERLRYFAADDQSARSTSLPLIAAATGLPKGEITAVMETEPGTFWLGSLRGIYVFRPAAPAGQQATALASTLPAANSRERANHYVFSLYRDAQGQLWQGSANGLARYSFTTRRWQTFDDVPGLLHELVLSIVPDRRGRLWLATLSKGVTVYDPATRRFHTLSETESGGPGTLDCWKLHRDALGDIWLGTEGNGLLRLDQTRDVFAPVPGSAKCTGLREMADDGHGGLWLVSYHTGLHHFDGRHITAVNYQRGLPPASVTSVATDRAGQLWLGTSQGLDGYDPRSGRVVRYGVAEGFFGHGASPGSIAFDRAGQLWVGTQQGLMCYDPRQVHPNTVPPVTNLTGVRLFLKGVAVRPGVSLAYRLNHLTFDYIGVSLTNPDHVRYRYRLRGLDDEQWVGPLVANSATYTNLPPGDYIFEVKAANNEGVWNEKPAAFAFTIRPPWCVRGGPTGCI